MVGGFLQRIDYVRKHAFGVMCILKNEKGEFPIRYEAHLLLLPVTTQSTRWQAVLS